jgi:hypothetical protein
MVLRLLFCFMQEQIKDIICMYAFMYVSIMLVAVARAAVLEKTTQTDTTTQTFPAEASGKTEPLLRLCPAEVLVRGAGVPVDGTWCLDARVLSALLHRVTGEGCLRQIGWLLPSRRQQPQRNAHGVPLNSKTAISKSVFHVPSAPLRARGHA